MRLIEKVIVFVLGCTIVGALIMLAATLLANPPL